jgi:hypothetical protein
MKIEDEDTNQKIVPSSKVEIKRNTRSQGSLEDARSASSIIRRRSNRKIAVFVDGPALDRASKRLSKKIDLRSLVRTLSSGIEPVFARYYTLIPFEDDSRHRSFLNAVEGAGFEVYVKRLPPKGITRQVSVDIEIATDLVAFSLGLDNLPLAETTSEATYLSQPNVGVTRVNANSDIQSYGNSISANSDNNTDETIIRTAVIVCPGRDLVHSFTLLKINGVETVCADFGKFGSPELTRLSTKCIDLSVSETIWRETNKET